MRTLVMASAGAPADDDVLDDLASNVAAAPPNDAVDRLLVLPTRLLVLLRSPTTLVYESESGVLGGLVAGADEPPRQGKQQRNTVRLGVQYAP